VALKERCPRNQPRLSFGGSGEGVGRFGCHRAIGAHRLPLLIAARMECPTKALAFVYAGYKHTNSHSQGCVQSLIVLPLACQGTNVLSKIAKSSSYSPL
jgi:hypothetical protein